MGLKMASFLEKENPLFISLFRHIAHRWVIVGTIFAGKEAFSYI